MRRVLLGTAFVVLAASAASAAQYVVSEARGVNFAVGSVIDPTKPIVLRQGQHLTLISESGQTVHIDGPYQKAPSAEHGVELAAALGGLISEQQARSNELGTMRGATPRPPLPDAWLIDATDSGRACLLEGKAPSLWRPSDKDAVTLSIMPADRSWKADTHWPAGSATLTLPANLGVHADASYFFAINDAEYAITIVNVPAVLTTDEMRGAWMIDKGCERQAEALLHKPQ